MTKVKDNSEGFYIFLLFKTTDLIIDYSMVDQMILSRNKKILDSRLIFV